MMIGACSLSEVKTKMPFLHPISPKTKLQKTKRVTYGKEKELTFFKIQLHNNSVLTYKFYTNIHEQVVNSMQLGRKCIHPSTYF